MVLLVLRLLLSTYSVTDACGTRYSLLRLLLLTITSTQRHPTLLRYIQCIADVTAADLAVVTDEADNCSVPVVAFVSDVSDGNTCPEIITRTYSVTDACVNQILVTQTITIDDNINPTASNPAPLTFQCIADLTAPILRL